MKELIVAAVIKQGEYVYWGFRHDRIIQQHPGKFKSDNHIQGFATNKERFLDRVEAAKFAMENGQVTGFGDKEPLFSEDLW